MLVLKTQNLESKQNKGQRQVIVDVLARQNHAITVEELTKKVQATGKYNGKGTKGHVNSWAMEKAGGDLGSVKYHLRALAAEKRVTLSDGLPKPERKKKTETPATPAPAAQPETPGEAAKAIEQMEDEIGAADAA